MPRRISRRAFIKGVAGLIGLGLLGSVASIVRDPIVQKVHRTEQYDDHLANIIERMKDRYAHIEQSADSPAWSDSIRQAFSRNELEWNKENLGIILSLNLATGFRTVPRAIDRLWTPSEDIFGFRKPETSGPLETKVSYVMQAKGVNYNTAMYLLNNLRIGMYYGVYFTKPIIFAYQPVENEVLRLGCIFADHNAGLYSSRNAGIQHRINELTGSTLSIDGVLMMPEPNNSNSKTEDVICNLFERYGVRAYPEQVHQDLQYQYSPELTGTETYQKLCSIAGDIPPVVAETPVRGLKGIVYMLFGEHTSKHYSQKRVNEYREIMQIIEREGIGPINGNL